MHNIMCSREVIIMKDFEYYEKKPESSIRSLSDLERYEIFNLESAEKYDSASNIDFIIDEEGNIKLDRMLCSSDTGSIVYCYICRTESTGRWTFDGGHTSGQRQSDL